MIEANRRNWDERAAIHRRDSTGSYRADAFLAGAGTHPGGGVMGASGRSAAKVVLRELGRG